MFTHLFSKKNPSDFSVGFGMNIEEKLKFGCILTLIICVRTIKEEIGLRA